MKTYTERIFEELVQNDNSTEAKIRRYLERRRREREARKMNMLHPKSKEELQDMIIEEIKKNGSDVDLNHIDTSEIEDMSYLFRSYKGNSYSNSSNILMSFSGDISEWDTSSVTNMSYMFNCVVNFNSNISDWDVSNVTNMDSMFYNARKFNQPIGCWDVRKVTNMRYMFAATEFNQPLDEWSEKLSQVEKMSFMFAWSYSFNQDINNWKLKDIKELCYMFNYSVFDKPLDKWASWINDSSIDEFLDFSGMFEGSKFNKDISNWQLRKYMRDEEMFEGCQISEDFKPRRVEGEN